MSALDHLSYGWVTPVIAYLVSALGCLLGFLIAKKARRRQGGRRTLLLVAASVAFGATGIWLMHMIALLGFTFAGASVKYDPLTLGLGLVIALVDIGTGLLVAGAGQRRWWRLLLAGLVIALGTTATQYVTMSAIRVNGSIQFDVTRLGVSAVVAVAVAAAALWSTGTVRRFGVNVLSAIVMGAALTAMHYAAASALRIKPSGSDTIGVPGVTSVVLLSPVILLGVTVLLMLAFFTIGNSSRHDMRSMYNTEADELDPDMIAEVTTRIAIGATAATAEATVAQAKRHGPRELAAAQRAAILQAATGQLPIATRRVAGARAAEATGSPRPRPTPGTGPTWRSMPVWGGSAPEPGERQPGERQPGERQPGERRPDERRNLGSGVGTARPAAAAAAAAKGATPATAAKDEPRLELVTARLDNRTAPAEAAGGAGGALPSRRPSSTNSSANSSTVYAGAAARNLDTDTAASRGEAERQAVLVDDALPSRYPPGFRRQQDSDDAAETTAAPQPKWRNQRRL